MKQKLALLLFVVLVSIGSIAGSSSVVKAAGDYTYTELVKTTVEDIDVYNDYTTNTVLIDTSIYNNQDGGHVYKITIQQDGFISMLLAVPNVLKIVDKWGPTGLTTTTAETKLTATVYRDPKLLYPVGQPVTAIGHTKGESPQKIALDKGTYYIAIVADKYISTVTGTGASTTTTITTVKGSAVLIVYYQEVPNNEIYRPSNVGKENQVKIDKEELVF